MRICTPGIIIARCVQVGDLLVAHTNAVRVVSVTHNIGLAGLIECMIKVRPVSKTARDKSGDMICKVEPGLELPLIATTSELTAASQS